MIVERYFYAGCFMVQTQATDRSGFPIEAVLVPGYSEFGIRCIVGILFPVNRFSSFNFSTILIFANLFVFKNSGFEVKICINLQIAHPFLRIF